MESNLPDLHDELWALIIQHLPRHSGVNNFDKCRSCDNDAVTKIAKHDPYYTNCDFRYESYLCNKCISARIIRSNSSFSGNICNGCLEQFENIRRERSNVLRGVVRTPFSAGLFVLSKRFYNIMKSLPLWYEVNREYIDRGLVSDVVAVPYENLKLCTNEKITIDVHYRIITGKRYEKRTYRKYSNIPTNIRAVLNLPELYVYYICKVLDTTGMNFHDAMAAGAIAFVYLSTLETELLIKRQ